MIYIYIYLIYVCIYGVLKMGIPKTMAFNIKSGPMLNDLGVAVL
jgi:hypothetical protein